MSGGEVVTWVQDQLPRRVESDRFGDLDVEQLSIFDNGYNAALTRVHNLLNMASAALDNGGCSTAMGSAFGGLSEAALQSDLAAAIARAEAWQQAFTNERQQRYIAQGMKVEQARIHAETDATISAMEGGAS